MNTDSLTFTDDLQFHNYLWELIQRATQFSVAKFENEWVVSWPVDNLLDPGEMLVEEDQYEGE